MKKIIAAAMLIVAAFSFSSHSSEAQTMIGAYTVSSCGGQTLSVGKPFPLTMDTTGNLCDGASGGGGSAITAPLGPNTAPSAAVSTVPVLPAATGGVAPYISAAIESCHVMKASQATVISYGVTTGATAGFLMVFNFTTAPADGAVTPAALAIQVPANATVTRTYSPPSTLQLSTGFTVCFSSTGPFTKTASATAMLEGTWQ